MGHSSMRAALIYLHANRGASKAIAAGIDRQLAEAAQGKDVKRADDGDSSGTYWHGGAAGGPEAERGRRRSGRLTRARSGESG
jgi:hypothetical protein